MPDYVATARVKAQADFLIHAATQAFKIDSIYLNKICHSSWVYKFNWNPWHRQNGFKRVRCDTGLPFWEPYPHLSNPQLIYRRLTRTCATPYSHMAQTAPDALFEPVLIVAGLSIAYLVDYIYIYKTIGYFF